MTTRVSSSDRTSGSIAIAWRKSGPPEDSFNKPHITTLGWLRSRRISSATSVSNRSIIFGESAIGFEAIRLLIDHQTNLVAQVELHPGALPDEADGVEAHHFHVQQVAPQEVGILRKLDTDRIVIAGVAAPQVDAAAVEPEVAVGKAEITEPTAGRTLVQRVGPGTFTRLSRDRDRDRSSSRDADYPAVRSASTGVSPAGKSRCTKIAASVSPPEAGETVIFQRSRCEGPFPRFAR